MGVVRLLLVHSPLTGCGVWDLAAAELGGFGYEPEVADLSAALVAGPPYCVRLIGLIARRARGRPVVLVGHSRAGPLLATRRAGCRLGRNGGAKTSWPAFSRTRPPGWPSWLVARACRWR